MPLKLNPGPATPGPPDDAPEGGGAEAVAQPVKAPKGAIRLKSPADPPARKTVRRAGSDTSWMLGLAERLLSSIKLKSLAIGALT
jgi:hypothetical protein